MSKSHLSGLFGHGGHEVPEGEHSGRPLNKPVVVIFIVKLLFLNDMQYILK